MTVICDFNTLNNSNEVKYVQNKLLCFIIFKFNTEKPSHFVFNKILIFPVLNQFEEMTLVFVFFFWKNINH